MLREVLCRLARVVIVRPMLVVMMARPFHVIDLVGDVKRFLERKLAVLHGKAVQRKQEHQENAENATHGKSLDELSSDYTNSAMISGKR